MENVQEELQMASLPAWAQPFFDKVIVFYFWHILIGFL